MSLGNQAADDGINGFSKGPSSGGEAGFLEIENRPIQGNFWYASHERLSVEPPSFQSDVFALALVVWEVLEAKSVLDFGEGFQLIL